MSGSDSKRNSTGSQLFHHRTNEFEREIGRATRERTRLIVEGFSNLALIATFFAGVQAQFISVTNDETDGPVAMATNAAFFGGLIFSIFTAVLATLSARWFSILREDDADYLSSRWLAKDSGVVDEGLLQKYLDYQIESLEKLERGEYRSEGSPNSNPPTEPPRTSGFSPIQFDAGCILRLLRQERGIKPEPSEKAPEHPARSRSHSEAKSALSGAEAEISKTTLREQVLSYILFSPLIGCFPSFGLFTAGILLLAWDRQPRPVAIFTTVTVLVCVLPLCGFFLRHRHKHVISQINLGRPSF